jgi:RNA polymerase primary sigma factor
MSDPIRSYLKDIKEIPLLTARQEIELATRIKRGDTKAKRQMTLSNLRLVINIAKRYPTPVRSGPDRETTSD